LIRVNVADGLLLRLWLRLRLRLRLRLAESERNSVNGRRVLLI
jgi:hypothetical protein